MGSNHRLEKATNFLNFQARALWREVGSGRGLQVRVDSAVCRSYSTEGSWRFEVTAPIQGLLKCIQRWQVPSNITQPMFTYPDSSEYLSETLRFQICMKAMNVTINVII